MYLRSKTELSLLVEIVVAEQVMMSTALYQGAILRENLIVLLNLTMQ